MNNTSPLLNAMRIAFIVAAFYLPITVARLASTYFGTHPTMSAEHRAAWATYFAIMTFVLCLAGLFVVACFIRLERARSGAGGSPPPLDAPRV